MKRFRLAAAILLAATPVLAAAPRPVADPHSHHHAPAADTRAVLALTPAERGMILEEMRAFLAGVQTMTAALAADDMKTTAQAARALGTVMTHEVPAELRKKLPQEFRQLGSTVHREFDQIAMDAESLGDPRHTLRQLSSTLQNCVACHAAYQIRTDLH